MIICHRFHNFKRYLQLTKPVRLENRTIKRNSILMESDNWFEVKAPVIFASHPNSFPQGKALEKKPDWVQKTKEQINPLI